MVSNPAVQCMQIAYDTGMQSMCAQVHPLSSWAWLALWTTLNVDAHSGYDLAWQV